METRLDRLITLHFITPMMKLRSHSHPSIPILMYHSVEVENESGIHPYRRTATSPIAFAAQMQFLQDSGFTSCAIAEGIESLKADPASCIRRVVLTFDDGYRNFYQNAFPILEQYGMTATVFLPTTYIAEESRRFNGRDCLTWSEVRELQQFGISFGSHTVSHPKLFGLEWDAIETEVTTSKDAIEQRTGQPVSDFAYPYAFPANQDEFRSTLRALLLRSGYHYGVCTTVGRAGRESDPMFLERLPINDLDDIQLFQAKLDGNYDWIAKPQSAFKSAKSQAAKLLSL